MLKNLVSLSMFTTFVVLIWISLAIYHAFTFSTITQDVNTQITPLNSTFNTSVISILQAREQIPVDLASNLSTSSAETRAPGTFPITKPIGVPTGTPSAALTPTTPERSTPNL